MIVYTNLDQDQSLNKISLGTFTPTHKAITHAIPQCSSLLFWFGYFHPILGAKAAQNRVKICFYRKYTTYLLAKIWFLLVKIVTLETILMTMYNSDDDLQF